MLFINNNINNNINNIHQCIFTPVVKYNKSVENVYKIFNFKKNMN